MFFIDAGYSLVLGRPQLEVAPSFQDKLKAVGALARSSALWISLSLLLVLSLSVGGVIYSSHLTRQLYTELEVLNSERDQYQSEWSQLLLEESALSAHGRIERIARDNMGMTMPDAKSVVIVR